MAPRLVILSMRGLPTNDNQGQGPRARDVTGAICDRLRALVLNCHLMSTMLTGDGRLRIDMMGNTTPEALAAAIDFGTARVIREDEVEVEISPRFVASAPRDDRIGSPLAPRLPEGRLTMPSHRSNAIPTLPAEAMRISPPPLGEGPRLSGADPVGRSLEELKTGIPHVCRQALARIGRCPPDNRLGEVVRALIPFLFHDDGSLAREAIKALGNWKSPESVPSLIAILQSDRVFERKEAIKALGKIQDSRAIEPMLACLDQDGFEVEEAFKSMGAAAEPALINRLVDPDVSTRRRVCDILGAIGGKATLERMQRMAPDSDGLVRLAAQSAWAKIVARVGAPPPLKTKRR